jgi:hypothetical protein
MYIYHIGLKDISYKFVEQWDINRNAIVIADSNKECREITSNNIGCGDEHAVNIKLWEKTKEIKRSYYFINSNGIWKNPKYTFCKKIGKALDKMKKGIVIVDHNAG